MSIDSAGSTTAEHAVSVDSVPASASSSLPSSTPLTTEGGSTAATPLAAVSSTVVSAIVDSVKALISSSTTTTTTTTTSSPTTTPFASTFSTKSSSSSSSSSSSTSPLHEKIDVADLSSSLQHFGIVDYCVFILMLVVCAVIGFYFGFIEKKKKSAKKDATIDNAERRGSEALDYLVGGRKMKVFPVSLSLVASFVSGVSLLGTSTEIYVYGTQYAFILITLALSGLISWYIFLPVFCNLQLTSTYEYFEMRFGRGIRSLGAVLFIVGMVLWLPVAIYVPAITFNQVTGIGIHVITPIVCIICTFYTCLGGLKAVIWTDVIQSFVMYGSILAVCIKGTIDVGGIDVVWQRNADGGRLNAPAYTWDPTVRLSMASVLIGGTLHKIQSSAVNQISIQRYLSLPSYKKARQAMFLFTILLTFLLLCCAYVGLVSFATFYDCDPLTTKLARASDQLPSLLMMIVLGSYPGLPGLFVAGVFSAALSSLSTGLNSLACVISQDIINPFIKRKLSERNTAIILRLIVIFFGLGCIGLVVVVEKLGMVLELSSMTGAVTMGPLLGVYTMGVCLPWINGKSAIFGSLVSFLTMSWICAHAQLAQMNGEIRYPKLPVSVEGCTYTFDNSTLLEMQNYRPNTAEERNIYHLSFLWYASSGFGICVVAASLSSLVFGGTNLEELDPALITPCMRRFLPKKNYQVVDMEELFQHKELSTSATATALEKLNIDKDIKE